MKHFYGVPLYCHSYSIIIIMILLSQMKNSLQVKNNTDQRVIIVEYLGSMLFVCLFIFGFLYFISFTFLKYSFID